MVEGVGLETGIDYLYNFHLKLKNEKSSKTNRIKGKYFSLFLSLLGKYWSEKVISFSKYGLLYMVFIKNKGSVENWMDLISSI